MNNRTATNLSLVPVTHYFFGRSIASLPPIGLVGPDVYTSQQVHGTNAIRVTKKDSQEEILHVEADAIWTTDNIAVGVKTADCAPVLFSSDDGAVIGAIHAGWRGAVKEIVIKTIDSVGKVLNIKPHRFIVAIGPCIGIEAFEVGPEVIDAVKATGVMVDDIIKKGKLDRFHLDLAGFIERQLHSHGVNQVEIIRRCTATHIDEYFSYRGNKGRRGDQLSVISKKPGRQSL